jgi:anti-sigma factor RsiW
MTVTEGDAWDPSVGPHIAELRLRRFWIGELAGEEREAVARHTAGCGRCRGRLAAFGDEQSSFAEEIPFARFAGGVKRARRVPRARPRPAWTLGAAGLAAAAALVLVARSSSWRAPTDEVVAPEPTTGVPANRLKGGGTEATVRIGGVESLAQRAAETIERLHPGERLRLGYRVEATRFLAAIAVDDAGEVTPLYPDGSDSLAVEPKADLTYLPDGVELTGPGRERLFLLLGQRPFSVETLLGATRAALMRAGGDISAMLPPALEDQPLEVFSWIFVKP